MKLEEIKLEEIKVSVIVPIYNLQDYIESCIVGLCEQKTDFNFEVIAIDDKSTDNSWEVLQKLANKYPVILNIGQNENNKGLAITMDRLLKKVKGKYIVYLDGDDIALPSKLQIQSNYLDSHQNCFMVYHEMDVFDSDTNQSLSSYVKDYYNRQYIPKFARLEHLIRYGCFVHIGSTMIRNHKNILDTVDKKNQIILDHPWLLMNMVFGNGSIDFIDETLGCYRIHDGSFGGITRRSVQRRIQVLNDQLNVCDLAEKYGLDNSIVQEGKRHYEFATALYFLKIKEDELFNQHITKSTDGKWFFDTRHKEIFIGKGNPDEIRRCYYN
jgi:glycosyltransferase involved in cell wall biosynthesis